MKTLKLLDRLSRNATLLFEVINELGNGSGSRDRGYIYASRQYMADRLKCSTRTITRTMHELKAAGYIAEKRMGRGLNNRIYIVERYQRGNDGTRNCPVKNGQIVTSQYNSLRDKINNTSILPQDSKSDDPTTDPAMIATPASGIENSLSRHDRTKTASTPRSPRIDRKARKLEAREKYLGLLAARLRLSDAAFWASNYCEYRDEYEAVVSLARLIANAIGSGRKIAVNGALLYPEDYWQPLQAALSPDVIWEVLTRWDIARTRADIRNSNAYLLAVIYNACVDRQLARDVV